MKLIQKHYQKTLLIALFSLLGLSTGAKKSYAVLRHLPGTIERFPKNSHLFCKRSYSRYPFPVKYTRPVWAGSGWSFAGRYHRGHHHPRVTWPYIPYSPFTIQALQTPPSMLEDKEMRTAVGPKKINFARSPQQTSCFVGRTKEIATLAPYFEKKDKLVVLPPIIGADGIGKTQLVHQLIAQYATQYHYVVWINAATQKAIEASYLQIAKELTIVHPSYNTATKLVQDRLEDKNVLYVFNNAQNITTIQPYLKRGHILITSSNNTAADWKCSHYDAPLVLAPFSEEEALQLAKAMRQEITDPSLIELIQRLPKYPLAMAQIFSNMSAGQYTPAAFLQELKQNNDLIKQCSDNPQAYTTYRNVLSTIVKSTLNVLQSSTNGAALLQLVQQMACLDAQPIPLSFVMLVLGEAGEEKQTSDMLSTLAKHGLVRQDADHIHMHGAIQAIIGHLYPLRSQQVKHLVECYVDHKITKVAGTPYLTVDFCHQMIPHGEKLLTYVLAHGEDDTVAQCYHKLSDLYFTQGNYQSSLECGNKSFILFTKIHGNDTIHPDFASSYHNLGLFYYNQGQYVQAIECYQKALEINSAVYGDMPHADIATAYNNLGAIYLRQGEYEQAIAFYQKSLDMRSALYGDTPHLYLASSYNNLGAVCREQGKYDKAILFFQKDLEIKQKVYGDKLHADMATVYNNLGFVYNKQGEYDQAIACYQKVLEMSKEGVDGDISPQSIAFAYHNLGLVYENKGKLDQTIACEQKVLEIKQKVYADKPNADIALSYNRLGMLHYHQRQYDRSVEAYEKVIEIREKVDGDKANADIANAYHNLGENYRAQGLWDKSVEAYAKSIAINKAVYGDKPHEDIASSYNMLGAVYYHQGQYDDVVACYEKSLEINKKIYGDRPRADIASAYNSLGVVYYGQRLYDKAIECYQKALEMYSAVYRDAPHADIATAYHNLGTAFFAQWKFWKAAAWWRKEAKMKAACKKITPRT